MNILAELRSRFAVALEPFAENAAEYLAMVRPAQDPKFGDFQANCAMSLAKLRKTNPRQVAEEIKNRLDIRDFCHDPEIAGPGFLNLRLRDEWLAAETDKLTNDLRLGVVPAENPRRVVVDFSSPNVAKPMHVGHLRSSVIGDAIYRLLKFAGHEAIGDNHIGDWGTQFGMIIYGYKHFLDAAAYERQPVDELARLYRKVNELAEQDPAIAAATREETARLHAGDAENRRLWEQFLPHCLVALQKMYDRLDIHFDHTLGESYYQPQLGDVVKDLERKQLGVESDGAICVFLEGNDAPFIIRKQDGAYTYATTDLATIEYRVRELRADEILYVVDTRQSEHFKLLFSTAKRWGYDSVALRHVSFGTILGSDRRPFRTRSGDTVGLESLLDEAVQRARGIVDENDNAKESPELDDAARARIAEIVGIGAIKYADLRHNRESDYVFSWDKMLATTGDTATYMQYAYARVCGIFRKGGVTRDSVRQNSTPIALPTPQERALALQLHRFAEAIDDSLMDYRPNVLTQYLFETAKSYSVFFDQCPVLQAESDELRNSRLKLCDLTARVIDQGLHLLGIETAEQM